MTEKSSPFLYTKFKNTEFISYELKNTALESYCFSDNSDIVKLLADVNQGSIARVLGGENELALGRITENIPQNPPLNRVLRCILVKSNYIQCDAHIEYRTFLLVRM